MSRKKTSSRPTEKLSAATALFRRICVFSKIIEGILSRRKRLALRGDRFVASLEEAVSACGRYIDTLPKRLRAPEVQDAYMRASQRLLILDYDGTLSPFAKQPWQGAPSPVVLSLLSVLAADPRNCVALTSGRTAEHMDRWFGAVEGLWLIAEHGAELKPRLASAWEHLRSPVSTDWKSPVMPILEHFVGRTPGSFVEEKKYGLVWHYRMAEPEFGDWLANELVSMLEAMLAETELRAFRGERIVEVRPVWANKGEAFERLLDACEHRDFVFAAGDDRTDEDVFERMQDGGWTVHVGPGPTRAAFVVRDFETIREVLQMFAKSDGVS
jgi:trehalose 6-phosphate synthase/phosphatase